MASKGKVLETVVQISGEISPTLGKTIGDVTKKLDGVNLKAVAVGASMAAIGGAAIAGLAKAGTALATLGDEFNTAVNDLSASTGIVGDELDAMADSIEDIYALNLGENFADIADAMALAKQNTSLAGDELEAMTADALRLRDTFEYDVGESTRAADALMSNFGITGEEAMGLIASGAQNGLDFSGELLDTISEYSVQFAKVGLDADAMFSIMQSGADGTAWNLDKVGDTVKEFSIRAIDGSDTTIAAFEALGMPADQMMQTFAEGGEAANQAFYDVLDALLDMEDPVARDAAGVALMGTMWEDMGVEAIQALADTEDAVYGAEGALDQIAGVKYDNLSEALEAVKRQAEVAFLPLATSFASALTDFAPILGELLSSLGPTIESLTEAVMPIVNEVLAILMEMLEDLGPVIDAVLPVLAELIGEVFEAAAPLIPLLSELLMSLLPLLQPLLSALTPIITMTYNALSPILTVLISLVNAVMPTLVAVLNALTPVIQFVASVITNSLGNALQFVMPIIQSVQGVLNGLLSFITNVFAGNWGAAWEGVKSIFSNVFEALAGIVKAPINAVISIVNGVIDAINSVGFTIPDWVPLIGGSEFGLDIPKIPLLATGGFTTGPSIAGEAGTEAVISFDPAYREDNLSYWARAGRLLGATAEDYSLSGTSTGTSIDLGGVTFAPNISINGKADRDSVIKAIEDEYPEFLDMLEQWLLERRATVYA